MTRRSWWLVGFTSVAAIVAASASGCSSDSGGGGATATDSGADTGTVSDAGGGGEAAACTPIGVSIATLDGGAAWSCIQTNCTSSITACAADCPCNNAIAAALQCVATDGGSQTACFTKYLTAIISDPNVTPLVGCLQSSTTLAACGVGGPQDGGEAGAHDASASDATASDTGTADTGTGSDAAATDAATGG